MASLITLALAFLPTVVDRQWATYISVAAIVVLGLLAVQWLWRSIISTHRIRTMRGIVRVGRERHRLSEFTDVWNSANKRVLCLGVGMTQVARDAGLVRDAASRGTKIEFIMVDPKWISETPTLGPLIDSFYQREQFVNQFAESKDKLDRLAAELNHRHGAGTVRIHLYQALIAYSATVADPGTAEAHGYVEFHVYGSPLGRFRLKVVDYTSESRNPSLLYHLLASCYELVNRDYLSPLHPLPPERQ